MANLIKLRCENNGSLINIKPGTTLREVLDMLHVKNEYPFISAYVNNRNKDLSYPLYQHKSVKFIDATYFAGTRVYHRTLFFILYKATHDLFPESKLQIKHSLGRGYYFELESVIVTTENADKIYKRMAEIVKSDIPITRDKIYIDEVREIYEKCGFIEKLRLLDTKMHLYITMNQLADVYGYFYGTLAASTSYTNVFDVKPYYDGFCLYTPRRDNPSVVDNAGKYDKLFEVFVQHRKLIDILNVSDIGSINQLVVNNRSGELIKIAEAHQEKLIGELADKIYERFQNGLKLILISGPSSSGKTTSSNRLNIQMRIFGLKPEILSMDNYFVNRSETPLQENGERDFEAVEALDIDLFNDHLARLVAQEEVEIPKYNFIKGERYYDGTKMKLSNKSILIVEGIHALNPKLTEDIAPEYKYRIYVSALTSVSMDNLSRISTTDNRLLRRIVRDSKYRNHTAFETIKRWGSVRRGEEENIFPYQEEADYMFNSALPFEISVLKKYAEPLLLDVPDNVEEYSEARRLLKMLDFFVSMDDKEVPPTSIIREFIGGSSINY